MFDLKKARLKESLSQSALAKRSGVGRFKISQHELGYLDLRKEDLQSIKKALGASNVTDKKK